MEEVTGIGHHLGCIHCAAYSSKYTVDKGGKDIIKHKCADDEPAFKGWIKRNIQKSEEDMEDLVCCCPEDDSVGAKYLSEN